MASLSEDELFCDADEGTQVFNNENPPEATDQGHNSDLEESTYNLNDLDLEDDSYSDDGTGYDYGDDGLIHKLGPQSNPQNASTNFSRIQPNQNTQRFLSLINVDKLRSKDKKDRATVEQVMDERTRYIIFKLLASNAICEINGCVSTGKEANVYHAPSEKTGEVAIKVFKTSILVFKDRAKYVDGDFRFQKRKFKGNNRKKVVTWAEKEYRNLNRLYSEGLNVPQPFLLRNHVILMEFIGRDSYPAPKLKEVKLTQSKACEIYREVIVMMWKMYNKAKLVHADLSEYNLLYYNDKTYVIDVSQSVEHEHPNALELLRKDCTNINDFFRRNKVATMSVKQLFDFITDVSINEENMEQCLEVLSEQAANEPEPTPDEEIDEEVFKNIRIPRTLVEIADVEADIIKSRSGNCNDSAYKNLIGLKADLSGTMHIPQMLEQSEEDSSCSDDQVEEFTSKFINASRPRHETMDEKKARKKAVKDAQADKRKTKMKKSEKKARVKNTRKR